MTKPTVYSYRRQWNPCHMDNLVLSSSKPLTGRTGQVEGRFSYWNHWRYTLNRTLPLPDKDSLHYNDMPCWLPSIEATSCYRNDETPSRKPTPRRRLLRIAHPLTPVHPLTPTSLTSTPVLRLTPTTSVQDRPPSPKYWTPTLTPLDTALDVLSNVYAQRSISS